MGFVHGARVRQTDHAIRETIEFSVADLSPDLITRIPC